MKISKLDLTFDITSRNKLAEATDNTIKGALAALESFYYSFNHKDIDVLEKVWLRGDLIQLNNPLGGILRGTNLIVNLYDKVFKVSASVWVAFGNIVCYEDRNTVVFAGEETGEFSKEGEVISLKIRTTRFFSYILEEQRWFQIHHHGSIDDPDLLKSYQQAVKG